MLPGAISAAVASTTGLPVQLIEEGVKEYPKPDNVKFTYGTAGVRTKGAILESVCYRIALISALRSKRLGGKTVGLMVTASHNPEEDNGLKAVDSRGEMLESSWESYCTEAVNATSAKELISILETLVSTAKINLETPASVVYAHDTRPTCPALVKAVASGLAAMGANIVDAGLKTTPQLHYLVKALNTQGTEDAYGEPTEDGYYKKLSAAYLKLVEGKPSSSAPLFVDCANGVGAPALVSLQKYIPEEHLAIRPMRTDTTVKGALNNGCGADYVKTNQRLPAGYEKDSSLQAGQRMCSFDGDADRIVYYYLNGPPSHKESFRLLDGDKIASLAADYISELVKKAGVELEVGCVQTAYANGSSTKYLKQRVPVTCTPTGVKHLHHAAERYDVGVYFEANGHGTVLFSPSAQQTIRKTAPTSPAAEDALTQLGALVELINQTVGDALSDMLMVEVILRARQWGPEEWDGAYEDLPNKLLKVNVPDRFIFKTEDAERRLTSPPGLQAKIDEVVGKYKDARSFVRPSGTEDCVRVYAETAIAGELDSLAKAVVKLVQDFAGPAQPAAAAAPAPAAAAAATEQAGPAKSGPPSFASLEETLCSPSPPTPLDAQFRALFTIKSLAASNPSDLPEGIRIIGRSLQTSDSALLKHELAYVLGQMQDSRAIPTLTKVLEDEAEHAMVRHEAAEAMGAIADPTALPILEHYKKDKDISVRETCELAIKKIEYETKKVKEAGAKKPAKDEENPFAPIDPAPAFPVSSSQPGASAASTSTSELLASVPAYRQTILDQSQTLFDRYRAMFSLRNVVHAARREAEKPSLSAAQRAEARAKGHEAVLALCDSLGDSSALFRHEICFVFGELAHASCVPSMLKVLSDDKEHEMVRHEAAEALGAVVEEGDEAEADDRGSLTEQVMKELKRWAEDMEAPRVVRESCVVALDEMAYNNDPSQFQPMDNALPQ